jgi:polyisoprenoid-binding protein YceI
MASTTTGAGTTRNFNEHEVPLPGRWLIDSSHSQIEFVARHMMIAKTRGRFREFSGTIMIAEDPCESSVKAVIEAATIDTGDATRDGHLRSADFLDVEHYPQITFESTSVRPARGDHWEVHGDLTIRNITRPVTLDTEFCGSVQDPWGNLRSAFLASTEINREDFDVTWNQVLESGGFLVGKGVKIEVDVEAVRQGDS